MISTTPIWQSIIRLISCKANWLLSAKHFDIKFDKDLSYIFNWNINWALSEYLNFWKIQITKLKTDLYFNRNEIERWYLFLSLLKIQLK